MSGMSWVDELSQDELLELSTTMGEPWVPRDEQRPDRDDWFCWFFRAGRGTGKTRAAAEWVRDEIVNHGPLRCALVAPTFADGRDVMVEGESGLLNVLPPRLMPKGKAFHWNRSIGELKLGDGSYLRVHSSENAGRLRGPQWHIGWVDEPAEFKDAALGIQADTTWFNLVAGLRLGTRARVTVTGTPKPVALIKGLVDRCESQPTWIETRGRTMDNIDNLAPAFRAEVVSLYEGTRLGRQELEGELLEGMGDIFDVSKLRVVHATPSGRRWRARCWDLAATEVTQDNPDPDWTVGVLVSLDVEKRLYCIEHVERFRCRSGERDDRIQATAMRDTLLFGSNVRVFVEQEPGSGGKTQVEVIARMLDGHARVEGHRPTGKKHERAQPVAGSIEQGRVSVLMPTLIDEDDPTSGLEWDFQAMTTEMGEFREDEKHPHDDIIDGLSCFWATSPNRPPENVSVAPISILR